MDYTNLGRTGLRVSRICLGMMSYGAHESRPWALAEGEAEPIVRRALEAGITFYDTADTYNGGESEIVTGRLLAKLFSMREEYVVATKVFSPTMPGQNGRGLSRKHVLASIAASLRRLGLDYVDLYQIHRWDPNTPIEETMEALHDVVKAGKYTPEVDFEVIDRLGEVASERGVPPAQMALAWLLSRPGVAAPIVGATKLAHLEDAIAAAELSLSEAEIRRLEEPYRPHAIAGHQ